MGVFVALLAVVIVLGPLAVPAQADDAGEYSKMTLADLEQVVEEKTAERDALDEEREDFEARIEDVGAKLASVEAKLPGAQSRADKAVVDRYKAQRHSAGLIEALLSAPDFDSFVTGVKYVESVFEASIDELVSLREEKRSLESRKEELESGHAEVVARLDQVSADLETATAARDEARRKAALVADAHLAPDGADWGAGEEKFVAAWAPRIDAYLAGSPLEGQGKTFAKAAWENHVDPRWSPAISHIESQKGRLCIRPHNAWGWGAADSNPYGLAYEWASWEDAINSHVSGLARGYGYTISEKGAQTYCPGNWEEWYATTVAQMNSI